MNNVFLIRRCHHFSRIWNYFLSTHGTECGPLWVFWHHSAFHGDTFHLRPAGFGARPFRQFISARRTKSCWMWLPPFQLCSLPGGISALRPLPCSSWHCALGHPAVWRAGGLRRMGGLISRRMPSRTLCCGDTPSAGGPRCGAGEPCGDTPGVAPGPAGSWARSSGALIRTDITHHNATGPPRQKGHGLFWKCYLMLISLYIGHWPQEWPAKIGCDLFPGKICYLPSFSWIWFVHDHPKSGLNLIQGFSRAWTRLMGNLPLNAELLTQVQWQELTCPANTPGCCVLHPACTGGYHSWPGFV